MTSGKLSVLASPRYGSSGTGVAIAASGGKACTIICGSAMPLSPAMPRSIATVASRPLGTERHPRDDDREQGQRAAGSRGKLPAELAMHDQVQSVQPAPQDEIPRGTVPQPAQQHRRHQIDVAPRLAVPVAAERDIDVLAQEPAQRDVPAAPEVGDVRGLVGTGEVQREPHVHHARQADRHVGIAGEIEVDLQRIGRRRIPRLDEAQRRTVRGGGEAHVGEVANVSASTSFFARPSRKIVSPSAMCSRPRDREVGRQQLRHDLARPHDRTGDQVRKERDEGGVGQQAGVDAVAAVGSRPGT